MHKYKYCIVYMYVCVILLWLHACRCVWRLLQAVVSGEWEGRGGNVVLLQTSSRGRVQSDKVIRGEGQCGGGVQVWVWVRVTSSRGREEVLGAWFTWEGPVGELTSCG